MRIIHSLFLEFYVESRKTGGRGGSAATSNCITWSSEKRKNCGEIRASVADGSARREDSGLGFASRPQ